MGARQAGRDRSGLQASARPLSLSAVLGAIYLKNHINTYWSDGNDQHLSSDPDIIALAEAVNVSVVKSNSDHSQKVSLISDVDKEYLRNVLIDAIIRTKDPLR